MITEAAALAAAFARRAVWRMVLQLTGGLTVTSPQLPAGPFVIVANHNSHADTAALLAALPARRRPAIAAAADYWFAGGGRRRVLCQALCGAFPVRRTGGGSADLAAAVELLRAGRDVIVYPEGTRSRDGKLGDFHRGAARLAAAAGVPLLPAGIAGTRAVLPPRATHRATRATRATRRATRATRRATRHATRHAVRRGTIAVRFGTPIPPGPDPASTTATARAQVIALAATPSPVPVSI